MHFARTESVIGSNMKIYLNGEEKEIPDNSTVSDLVKEMEELLPKLFVVERNEKVVYKEQYNNTDLLEGDKIEVVVFAGGG